MFTGRKDKSEKMLTKLDQLKKRLLIWQMSLQWKEKRS